MASLVKHLEEKKQVGRVYTPNDVVEFILNKCGYIGPEVLGKTVLDPACGDGQFLCTVVKRILEFSLPGDVQENLAQVHGWDIDENAVNDCISRLDQIVFPLKIDWNVEVKDSIQLGAEIGKLGGPELSFDFIVGNPPYVRIQNLDKSTRELITKNYIFCKKGATDLYLAFFELAIKLMPSNARCGFITPNSFLSTSAGDELRKYFTHSQTIEYIANFGATQLFPDASTYTAVTIFGATARDQLCYEKRESVENVGQVSWHEYTHIRQMHSWNFGAEGLTSDQLPLDQVCGIHVGIQTLADKVFVFNKAKMDFKKSTVILTSAYGLGEFEVERDLFKPAIKASKIKPQWDGSPDSYIIWPYTDAEDSDQTGILSEAKLRSKFPLGFKYLSAHKQILNRRDNGKENPFGWFAFGRQQHLRKIRRPKIVFPSMVERPFFVYSKFPELVVYSGYFVSYDGAPEELLKELNSVRMVEWVSHSGRDLRGSWKTLSKSTIAKFPVPASLLTSEDQ